MNRLMEIKTDKAISGVDCATEEEVNEFEEGFTTGPELHPMRPYLDSSRHNAWNDELCEKFIEQFEEEVGTELTLDNKATIEKMFHDRLSRLVRTWKESKIFSSEELKERELKSNQLARRNTRRLDVSSIWIPDVLMLMIYQAVQRATSNMPWELEES